MAIAAMPDRLSLNAHLFRMGADDALRHVINDIARACKYIQHAIRTTEVGLAGSTNASGENQLKLDVLSNMIVGEELKESHAVKAYASEEEEGVKDVQPKGTYTVVFDPLDGSSLVDVNFAVGSIFGIYKGDFLTRTPRDQVAALYAVYGPRTLLVCSIGKGVHVYYLNDVGEFLLLKEQLTVGDDAPTYSPGNLRAIKDTPSYRAMLDRWLDEQKTLRYSGGMVPDVHHILIKGGGVFTNIGGSKYPQGKLRLAYECGPLAYLMEQAGGAASAMSLPILDVRIDSIDQRTPIVIGSKKEVERVVGVLRSL
jgi:fructose-1,6-bisphosphatase I